MTTTTTKHTHRLVFGRRVAGCPRCAELDAGAPAVRQPWRQRGALRQQQLRDAIRSHDCRVAGCGPVCTAFDW
jgi:hypothetical protein